MKLEKILPLIKNKEVYICSESISMYDQTFKTIKFWLFIENCKFFAEMTKTKDWKFQDKKLGEK